MGLEIELWLQVVLLLGVDLQAPSCAFGDDDPVLVVDGNAYGALEQSERSPVLDAPVRLYDVGNSMASP